MSEQIILKIVKKSNHSQKLGETSRFSIEEKGKHNQKEVCIPGKTDAHLF